MICNSSVFGREQPRPARRGCRRTTATPTCIHLGLTRVPASSNMSLYMYTFTHVCIYIYMFITLSMYPCGMHLESCFEEVPGLESRQDWHTFGFPRDPSAWLGPQASPQVRLATPNRFCRGRRLGLEVKHILKFLRRSPELHCRGSSPHVITRSWSHWHLLCRHCKP